MTEEQIISHQDVYDKYQEYKKSYPIKNGMEIRKMAIEWAIGAHEIRYKIKPTDEDIKKYCKYMEITDDFSTFKAKKFEDSIPENGTTLITITTGLKTWQKAYAYFCIGGSVLSWILVPIYFLVRGFQNDGCFVVIVPLMGTIILFRHGQRILEADSPDINVFSWSLQ